MEPEKLGGRTLSNEDFGLGMAACRLTVPGAVEFDLLTGLAIPEGFGALGGTTPPFLPALSVRLSRLDVSELFIARAS